MFVSDSNKDTEPKRGLCTTENCMTTLLVCVLFGHLNDLALLHVSSLSLWQFLLCTCIGHPQNLQVLLHIVSTQ